MNKREFLKKLDYYLLTIDDRERDRFINYYEEIIEDYVENGLSEEEAVKKIGNPQQITRKILGENEEISSIVIFNNSILKNVLIIILLPIWGPLLLTFYIILAAIVFTIASAELVTAVVSIVSIFGCPFVAYHYNISVGIMQLGVGVSCLGICLLLNQAFIVFGGNILLLFKKTNRKVILILRGCNYEKKDK